MTNTVSVPDVTIYADGKQSLNSQRVFCPSMSHFQVSRQYTEWLIEEMIRATTGAKDGPGYHLDALMRSWVDADCNLERWALQNPDKFEALRTTCEEWRVTPFEGMVPKRGHLKPSLQFDYGLDASDLERYGYNTSEIPLRLRCPWLLSAAPQERVAYKTFAVFVVILGTSVRLGICDRCGKYFWGRRINKRFCGRKCSQLQTATEGQARKIAKQRQEKNRKIRKALRAFLDSKSGVRDWKAWVASRAGVTRNYLTHALNRGAKGEPDGLKLTKLQARYLESKGESHGNL